MRSMGCLLMMAFARKTASFVNPAMSASSSSLVQRKSASLLVRRASTATATSLTTTKAEEKVLADALYRIRKVNYMPEEIRSSLLDFTVDGTVLGNVRPNIAKMLCSVDKENPVFCIQQKSATTTNMNVSNSGSSESFLTLTKEAGTSMESRTESVNRIMKILRDQDVVTGWRDENYPVRNGFYEDTVFGIERSAAPLIGCMEYGVHINGIVQGENGAPKMWIARRAKDKSKYPGMLDHIVAGGQPVGLSLLENVIKECKEEAGVPEDLTRAGIRDAGGISYYTYSERNDCVTRCVLFCYDLHLPSDFVPKPVDGEVEEFFLWDMDQIKQSFDPDFSDPMKPNVYPW